MKRLLAVLAVLLLFAAVPAVSADEMSDEFPDEMPEELRGLLDEISGLEEVDALDASVANSEPMLSITKVADPDTIYRYREDGCLTQWTDLTLSVTGYGGVDEEYPDLDVVFAIDSSGSMQWNDPTGLRKTAAKDFVGKLDAAGDIGDHYAGVVGWDTLVDLYDGLYTENFFGNLNSSIDAVNAAGGTNLDAGLAGAIGMLDSSTRTATKVIIFLTDGQGTYTPSGGGGPVDDAVSNGYIIYSIGLSGANSGPLEDMADATGGKYYSALTAENLDAIFDEIYTSIKYSTSPYYVIVQETVQGEIMVDKDEFSIEPDLVWTNPWTKKTHIIWYDVGMTSFDGKMLLTGDDTFEVTFPIASRVAGSSVPVDVTCPFLIASKVIYLSPDGCLRTQYIEQEELTVIQQVALDLKPTSCPNAFNPTQKGVLPVAVAGDECFDVNDIDPATVMLNGEPPIRWAIEDVTSPIYCPEDTCYDCVASCCLLVDCLDGSCTGCDGYDDLTLKFDSPAIADTLGPVIKEDCKKATLTGQLNDGTPIEGYDWLWITKNYEPENNG
ncbi:vWA domain-containing protein [Methanovulcanius yangii]|uniref:vWA domain-containing protein n=1 Tax=Methanovulcanius yangii TaxID=1789227 RepID=UPI0029C9BFFF|nr:vWA domain-containing protein [Methanovulcanius yangii]